MSDFTLKSWGIEQTREMLWIGPMRPDGMKVDEVVVGLTIGQELTMTAALKQLRNAHLIAAAPDLLEALLAAQFVIKSARPDSGSLPLIREAIAKALGKEEV
jgi:hypothetical protein